MEENKIKELFTDEAFVKLLLALETPQEVQSAVGAKGLELSVAEIEMIRERIVNGNDELSAEELDNVAGGIGATLLMVGFAASLLLLTIGCGAAGLGIGIDDAVRRRW